MLETLHAIDTAIFLFLNVTISNPLTDTLMPIITSDNLLRIAYGLSMALILWKGSPRLRWLVLSSALALLISDQLSSNFLKPLIERPRPCHIMTDINLLVGCGGGFAMPSSHAVNAFAQASLFAVCVPWTRWYLIIIASVIALSRVFVGVHYPFDVAVGAGVGAAVGCTVAYGFTQFESYGRSKSRFGFRRNRSGSESAEGG